MKNKKDKSFWLLYERVERNYLALINSMPKEGYIYERKTRV